MKLYKLTAAIPFIIMFLPCSDCSAQTTGILAVKKEIQKTNAVYFDLFTKKNMAIVDLYTDDGCLMVPNLPPITGREALKKDFGDTFAAGKIKGVKFFTGEVYGDGQAYVTEEGTWQVYDIKGKLLDYGKYLKLWKRTKGGWKIFRHLFNGSHKEQQKP